MGLSRHLYARTRQGPRHLPASRLDAPGLSRHNTTMRTEPLVEAQQRLDALADEVETTHDRILLVRAGHPDLALIRADELDAYREWVSFRETEDLVNDPQGQREIAESRDAYRRGDFMTIAEARARLR